MKFDFTIKVSDLLTSLTIIVSVLALLSSWSKDQNLRKRDHTDRIRKEAAFTLAKLERWETLTVSLYSDLQPVFVETSELLSKDFNIVKTRDYLWKEANNVRANILTKKQGENIETAYIGIFGFRPEIRSLFLSTLDELKKDEDLYFWKFVEHSQQVILQFEDRKDTYTTASLGNALRGAAAEFEVLQRNRIKKVIENISNKLTNVVMDSDDNLLKNSN